MYTLSIWYRGEIYKIFEDIPTFVINRRHDASENEISDAGEMDIYPPYHRDSKTLLKDEVFHYYMGELVNIIFPGISSCAT